MFLCIAAIPALALGYGGDEGVSDRAAVTAGSSGDGGGGSNSNSGKIAGAVVGGIIVLLLLLLIVCLRQKRSLQTPTLNVRGSTRRIVRRPTSTHVSG